MLSEACRLNIVPIADTRVLKVTRKGSRGLIYRVTTLITTKHCFA